MSGEYWPEDERFGMFVVSGYANPSNGADHGFDFHVVDLNRQAEVVRTFTRRGRRLEDAHIAAFRETVVDYVDGLNREEALVGSV